MNYQPRLEDIQFILEKVLHVPQRIAELPAFAEVDADLMNQVLDEAGKFVANEIAPLNRVGDEVGAQFNQGHVTMPPGFKDAYQAFWQSGWASLCTATEDGGQSLPAVLESVLYEWLSAANHGWTMAPGLLHGAYECIKHHASDELKAQYLSKVGTGEWLATMCLTEPHAGSDLGLARTKAVPQADGSYHISGTKIFISGGDHDLTENIVHLVLARLPEAPAGPKGLSLFLVPKFYADGSCSAVHCERIEEKMGIHGSPTCVMRFDEAKGWLVGEVGKGLNAMFVMMNAARLHVGLQGVGLLDAAWQKANAYAHERRQMRAPKPAGVKGEPTDFIIEHPAMRRILDTQRAWIDGSRVLAYQTGLALDIAKHHPDAAQRESAQRWCALTTPILKAACTEQGFHGASDCLQVFGGHGYVSEWGIEQNVRDARIAMIYEGTNEIQAIDLLMRKVLGDGGVALNAMLDELSAGLNAQAPHEAQVLHLFAQLRDITQQATQVHTRPDGSVTLSWIAGDYLRVATLALLAWSWTRIEAAQPTDAARWHAPAAALRAWVLPEFEMRLNIIRAQFKPA
ncbi:acyl-CoA dehydrogenase family protein [Limnohabitans sp. TEGF004]|jgi:alkylation response protein AidB-like acyl-CoA dehydrogenase|uniref:acyl-CoA dehydrogenase family protein n=1 Tax=Limnohabitans sp. TEGF004 TaxID=2986281 RepID=UPI002377378C|nr:acyl-CoA dehydrogenase family protein [Limnohabitans sp. TEGF004]BDU55239.1 acyl-CoA dehydrogenase [Limnohabitans sp. TEGF004]